MTEFKISYKDKHSNQTIGYIDSVDPSLLEEIDRTIDSQFVTTWDWKEMPLKDLKGDVVLNVNGITLVQIAWLARNRNVVACILEHKNEWVTMDIQNKDEKFEMRS
jgi:hypothetical protein